jgi:hypothetical protein
VLGSTERLGEALRADDNCRVIAPRLDAQHQVAVLEDGLADQLIGAPQLVNCAEDAGGLEDPENPAALRGLLDGGDVERDLDLVGDDQVAAA